MSAINIIKIKDVDVLIIRREVLFRSPLVSVLGERLHSLWGSTTIKRKNTVSLLPQDYRGVIIHGVPPESYNELIVKTASHLGLTLDEAAEFEFEIVATLTDTLNY